MKNDRRGWPFFIIAGAIILLLVLSLVPWSEITGNRIKDFNLFADLFPGSVKNSAEETIDPNLEAAMANGLTVNAEDSVSAEDVESKFNVLISDDGVKTYDVILPKDRVNNVASDSTVIMEDYTVDNSGLKNLKNALKQRKTRPVRIAVIGDSYIEGDILTMNIRESLQNRYGGSGVGYMPAFSDLTGFRTTVRQVCDGWTKHEIRNNARNGMKTIQGEYFTAAGTGKSTYKGVNKLAHLDSWENSTVLAVARNGGTITLMTDTLQQRFQLAANDSVQALTLEGRTQKTLLTASNGVEILGVYLNDNEGVVVDNMSLRGNSGITHRKLSRERAEQMRQFVDYDLIVIEYGINALSSQQSDYTAYKNLMKQIISCLKDCYPNADIVLVGIGDRGQKKGGEVRSVPTSQNMVTAQRDAARETGILFWDTREAMGGEDAVLKWRAEGLINADYIHLNHKGGKALADLFVKALAKAL